MAYYRRHRASFLGLLLGGRRGSPVYNMVTAGFLLLAGVFCLIIWGGEKMAYDELIRTCITKTDGTIISVETSREDNSFSRAYVEFTAGGKKFNIKTDYTLDKKEEGGTVPVHYCPADPEKAYCYEGPDEPDTKLLGFFFITVAITIVIVLISVIEMQHGVESGGVIGDSLKAKKNFADDSWKNMSQEDLADARRALTMPGYMHEKSRQEMDHKYGYGHDRFRY